MILVFLILILTILMFIWGKLRPDMVAVLSLLALLLTGIIDSTEALSGFSDNTVIMIAALFVVGEGLSRSGIAVWLGHRILLRSRNNQNRLLLLVMIGTAILSAFISNTGTVAMMIPVVVAAAWGMKSLPSKFLLPVAISANIAGALTLISTSTNIIVSDTLENAGQKPFGFFEFTLIGLPMMVVTILYMLLWGKRLLPEHQPTKRPVDIDRSLEVISQTYSLEGNIYWLNVLPGSDLAGQTLRQANIGTDFGVTVLHIETDQPEIQREVRVKRLRTALQNLRQSDDSQKRSLFKKRRKATPAPTALPSPDIAFGTGDMLLVKGEEPAIERLTVQHNLSIEPISEMEGTVVDRLLSRELGFAEVIIPARSRFEGTSVVESNFAENFDLQVVSATRQNRTINHRTESLQVGDALLVRGTWKAIAKLRADPENFVVVGQPEIISEQIVGLNYKAFLALVILIGMVIMMLTGVVPVVIATLLAAVAMVLFDVVTMPQAYGSINWSAVVLIAALIPMGIALDKTGGVDFMARGLVNTVGTLGPLAMMAGIFLLSSGFSQVISNVATSILISPVAYQAALAMDVSPYPFMMMVAVGVVTGIMTPIAGAPMLIVMNPGNYSFKDYAKVGFPLIILVFILSLVLVPLIWPL